jgi:hypothetical protein
MDSIRYLKSIVHFYSNNMRDIDQHMGRWQSRRQGSRRETKIGVARKSEALLVDRKRWRRLLAVSSMQTNLGTKHRGFESSK